MAQDKKEEKVEAAPVEFLQKLAQLRYPMADVVGKMVEIPREDKEYRTFGFMDGNGRREVALTATKAQWTLWFQDALHQLE